MLHQRLPRHDPRLARGDRQRLEARRRRRPAGRTAHRDAVLQLHGGGQRHRAASSACWRRRLRPRPAGRGDRRDRPGRGRHQRGQLQWLRAPGRAVRASTTCCSSSTTSRWAAAAPGRSSASSRPGSRPTSSRLSKSISGYGLPMALTLLKPELDVWEPGRAQRHLPRQQPGVRHRHRRPAGVLVRRRRSSTAVAEKTKLIAEHPGRPGQQPPRRRGRHPRPRASPRAWCSPTRPPAARVSPRRSSAGLLIETSGPESEVVKLMPPLTITPDELDEGLRHPDRRPSTEVARRASADATAMEAAK